MTGGDGNGGVTGDLRLADVLDALADAVAARLADAERAARGLSGVEPYLNVEQAAKLLGDAPTSRVYDLAASGRLRVVRDGRRVLTRASWIIEYLEGSEAA